MIRSLPLGHNRKHRVRSRLVVALLAGSAVASLALTGCSNSESGDGTAKRDTIRTTTPANSLLAGAGFVASEGVQIDRSDSQRGQDQLIRFVLTGKAEDIDKALEAAKWKKPFTAGNTVTQQPLPGSGIELWTKVETSADEIKVDGKKLYRRVVRGTQDGLTKLHVWAFTT